VNASITPQRLAQAQRIAAIKVQRQERERVAAVQAERDARARAAAAEARAAAAAGDHRTARDLFFAQPQLGAAEVWLIATDERAQHASNQQLIAADKNATASAAADVARRSHERACERAGYIDTRAAALTRDIARRAQERADEDMQERSR
jgi:hypothetical protein